MHSKFLPQLRESEIEREGAGDRPYAKRRPVRPQWPYLHVPLEKLRVKHFLPTAQLQHAHTHTFTRLHMWVMNHLALVHAEQQRLARTRATNFSLYKWKTVRCDAFSAVPCKTVKGHAKVYKLMSSTNSNKCTKCREFWLHKTNEFREADSMRVA